MVFFTTYVFVTPICFPGTKIYSEHWVSRASRTPYLFAIIHLLSSIVVLGVIFADSTPLEIARNIYSRVRQARQTEQPSEPDNTHVYGSSLPQSENNERKLRTQFGTELSLSYSGGEVVTTGSHTRRMDATVSNSNPQESLRRHVDCTLVAKLVRAVENEHGKLIVQLLRDFHTISALKLCIPPAAWLSPKCQSILKTFKGSYAKGKSVSQSSMDPSSFITTMGSQGFSHHSNASLGSSPQELKNRIARPAIPIGKVRLTWTCVSQHNPILIFTVLMLIPN